MYTVFDQFQRYKNAQLIINSIRRDNECFKILEVGANEHKNLERYLPKDNILFLDIELTEKMKKDPSFVEGDATAMTYEDDSFDIVIALDVFEHIPEEKRKNFLNELNRVSKRCFLISAPFDSEAVHSAEMRVNANFACMYNMDHPWLIEHIENGLPNLNASLRCLEDADKKITILKHGDVDIWERMTNIEFTAECDERLEKVGQQLHDFYNKNLFVHDYNREECYRTFIIGMSKEWSPDFIEKVDENVKSIERFANLERSFWNFYQGLDCKNKQLQQSIDIFGDCGEGFTPQIYKSYPISSGVVRQKVTFATEDGRCIKNLRIDPIKHSGIMKLERLAIYDVSGNIIYDAIPEENQCANIKVIRNNYYFCIDDPQFVITNIEQKSVQVLLEYSFMEIRHVDEIVYDDVVSQLEMDSREYSILKDKEKEMQDELSEKNANLENQKIEIKQKQMEIENLHNAISGLESRVTQVQTEMAGLHERHQAEMQVVLHSTSWKITKPYRFVARGVKKTVGKLIPRKVRKAGFILIHNGPGGLKREIQSYERRKNALENCTKNIVNFDVEELKRERKVSFPRKILFSIIVPLYNTPEKYLVELIEFCQNQTYGNWELCFADGSDDEHKYVGEIVHKLARKDHRILYKKLEKNDGISVNTNQALEMAHGDYIALLDHDDLLHPSALHKYMKVICEQNADFIYCDEMTFEGDNLQKVITLHYKPDFAIDNLRANNYICHFSVFSKKLLDEVGMFRKEFDGSQDHDMILRLTERAKCVVHVPEILYFWRSHPASVASDINSKQYAIDAGKRAVLSHLERFGLKAEVKSSKAFPTIFNIFYEITDKPLVSIVIPNKDNVDMLSRCLNSIKEKTTYQNYEVIVIENNSELQETFDYYHTLQAEDKVSVIKYEETGFNYSAINNFGVRHTKGKHLIFLNNDIEIITPDWIEQLLMYSQRKDVGVVGAKLYYPDNTIQHGGIILKLGADRCAGVSHHHVSSDNLGYMGRLFYAQDVSAVTGACMMMSREIFDQTQGFDEALAVAYNDVDLCLAVRKLGYLNIWTPCMEAIHYESVSRGNDLDEDKRERFLGEVKYFKEKWEDILEKGDPYYNPNLTLNHSDFSVK